MTDAICFIAPINPPPDYRRPPGSRYCIWINAKASSLHTAYVRSEPVFYKHCPFISRYNAHFAAIKLIMGYE